MMTAEKQVEDAVAELREIAAGYRAGVAAYRRRERAMIDIIVQHADIETLTAVLDYLERSACDWSRWPAETR